MIILIYVLLGILAFMVILFFSLSAIEKKGSETKTPPIETTEKEKGVSVNIYSKSKEILSGRLFKMILAIGLYVFILIILFHNRPDIQDWFSERSGLLLHLHLTVLVSILIFSMGSKWTKYLLFPVLIIVLGWHALGTVDHEESRALLPKFSEKLILSPAVPDEEIKRFLQNPKPPENIKKLERQGQAKNVRKIFSGTVDVLEWTAVITIPEPPPDKLYRVDAEVLSGRVWVQRGETVVGKYPDKNFDHILEVGPLSLRFKSADRLRTAIKVWRWEENR